MRQYHLSAPARMNAVMEMHLESVFAADEAPKTRTCIRTRSARTAFNYVCKRTPTPNLPPSPIPPHIQPVTVMSGWPLSQAHNHHHFMRPSKCAC